MTDDPLRATISQKAALFGPDGDVLLLDTGETWEFPGGRLGADERAEDGLRREVREETGIDPTVGWPVYAASWRNADDDGRFAVVYCCETPGTDVDLSDEHVDYEWVDPVTAALDRLDETQATALERAMEERNP